MSLAPGSDVDRSTPASTVAPPPTPQLRVPRSVALQVAVLLVLLAPVVFLNERSWRANEAMTEVVATERAAAVLGRPLNGLLAALVDAQYTAARSIRVDDSAIRASISEVDRVHRSLVTSLSIDQRWPRLASEIDAVLARNPAGEAAVRAFAVPIAMNRELLGWLADSSQVTRDPSNSFHLIDVALKRSPEVLSIAGELSSLAHTAPADRQVAVLRDRIARAAQEVSAGLGAASLSPDLPLLAPLDEFTTSADALSRAVSREDFELAAARVEAAGVALESAALNTFEDALDATTAELTRQRQTLLLAGGLPIVAAIVLGWLMISRRRVPAPPPPPSEPDSAGAERRTPNIIDARELLARR